MVERRVSPSRYAWLPRAMAVWAADKKPGGLGELAQPASPRLAAKVRPTAQAVVNERLGVMGVLALSPGLARVARPSECHALGCRPFEGSFQPRNEVAPSLGLQCARFE